MKYIYPVWPFAPLGIEAPTLGPVHLVSWSPVLEVTEIIHKKKIYKTKYVNNTYKNNCKINLNNV